ncbi:MAG: hypothetical protein ABIH90_02205 [Candidatus Aenigmatarchaeota archaeon]
MKGEVSTWIWVVGGLIIGVSIILFATTMSAGFFRSYQENSMREKFLNLADRANAICSGGEGNTDYFKFVLSEVVRAVYPAKNKFERPPDKVSELISGRESGEGNYICFSLFEQQEPSCKEISCPVEMEYIGTPSLKEDLFSILSKIRGEFPIYAYNLVLEKAEGKVWITRETRSSQIALDGLNGVEVFGTCDGNPVLVSALNRSVLFFGDATLWVNGNTEFAKLLRDAYTLLGEGRILVIYEDENSRPDVVPKIKSTLDTFVSDPYVKHTTDLSVMFQGFQNYDQVWLVRPGWCGADFREGREDIGCDEVPPWTPSEVKAIADFVSAGGKIFLITDYQGSGTGERRVDNYPSDIVNQLLQQAEIPFRLGDGYICRKSSLEIENRDAFPSPARMDIRYASIWQKAM